MTSGCVRASGVLVLAVWKVEEDFRLLKKPSIPQLLQSHTIAAIPVYLDCDGRIGYYHSSTLHGHCRCSCVFLLQQLRLLPLEQYRAVAPPLTPTPKRLRLVPLPRRGRRLYCFYCYFYVFMLYNAFISMPLATSGRGTTSSGIRATVTTSDLEPTEGRSL